MQSSHKKGVDYNLCVGRRQGVEMSEAGASQDCSRPHEQREMSLFVTQSEANAEPPAPQILPLNLDSHKGTTASGGLRIKYLQF